MPAMYGLSHTKDEIGCLALVWKPRLSYEPLLGKPHRYQVPNSALEDDIQNLTYQFRSGLHTITDDNFLCGFNLPVLLEHAIPMFVLLDCLSVGAVPAE